MLQTRKNALLSFCNIMLLILIPFFSFSEKPGLKDENCFILKGSVRENNDDALFGVSITVYRDSSIFFSTITENVGKCKIKLPLHQEFTIEFSKPSYVSKKIMVNTSAPDSKKADYTFLFTLYLFEEIKDLDVSVLKSPLALIGYNKRIKQFDYDADFTDSINEKIEELYENYYSLINRSGNKD